MRSYGRRSASVLWTLAVVAGVLILAVGCSGPKSGSGSASGSPTSPSSSTLSGTWTGTLSRPDGLAPIAVRWEAIRVPAGPMSGPLSGGPSGLRVP